MRKIRKKFIKEFPEYKNNCYYIQKFGKMKRAIFSINEWSPHLYAYIYKISRLIDRKR